MVEPVKYFFAASVRIWMAALPTLALLLLSGSALAVENLPDPTQPSGAQGGYQDAGDANGGGNVGNGGAGLPSLQSVLISPTVKGRRLAIINGQTLRIGDKLGSAVLIGISESEAVLRNGQDVQVLKLFPAGEKHVAKAETADPAKAEAGTKQKKKRKKIKDN